MLASVPWKEKYSSGKWLPMEKGNDGVHTLPMSVPEVLYLFLPAFIANAMPVVARKIPGLSAWNTPVSARLFGKNKTYRGFAVGIGSAVITALIQYALRDKWIFAALTELHTSLGQSTLVGILLGAGALFGDLAKSFVKRRIGIEPGNAWPVLDGIDYVIGAVVFIFPLYHTSVINIVVLLIAAPLLSLTANTASYLLGWKEVWY